MRLMFLTGSLAYGGAERHAITLANRLTERGHECHAAWVKRDSAQLARLRLDGVGSALCLDAARYLDLGAAGRLAGALRRYRPEALVAANPYALMYGTVARARARLRIPLVVIYHSTRWPGLKQQAQLLAYRPCMWASERAVFVCEYQRHYCLRRGLRARRNAVIPNGVDVQYLRDAATPAERATLRAELGYGAADYVVGIVAGLRREKNHTQLLEAAARLRAQGLATRLLLVGDGPMRPALESRARALGLGPHLQITGFRDDIRPFVAACDVMCICSFTEALSLAAIESMAMSRPVVHSRVGGAAELIESGRDGLLFPAGDTAALIDRLLHLTDPGARSAMGRAARATVERRFSERRMIDGYEELLREVCA